MLRKIDCFKAVHLHILTLLLHLVFIADILDPCHLACTITAVILWKKPAEPMVLPCKEAQTAFHKAF